jgi:hypothetical protein
VIFVERVVPNDVPATDPRIEDAQSRGHTSWTAQGAWA